MKPATYLFLILFLVLSACYSPHSLEIPTASALPTTLSTETEPPTPEPTASESPTSTPPATMEALAPAAFDHSPRSILLEADLSPNGTTPRDEHVITFRLYGDGFIIFAGDQAPLTSGLDTTVRTGYLSESEIQNLISFINQSDFLNLNAVYPPRLPALNTASAQISVYLNRAKTVRVYEPDSESTPHAFKVVLDRIKRTVPADAQNFTLSDAFLQATPAGFISDLGQGVAIGEWSNVNVRLADAVDGIVVSRNVYTQIATLFAQRFTNGLYREGDRVYRVRFAPNLPRGQHLTDWIGVILDGTREFDGRAFEIIGYYRGANLFDEARGAAPNLRNVWVIADASGAMYVAGVAPSGLNANSRADAWMVVRVRGTVNYVRSGTSYIQAQRVDVIASNVQPAPAASLNASPSPSASTVTNADAAIALIKVQFAQVSKIQKAGAGIIGGSQNIFVFDRSDGWDLAFWEGSGDCPAGCINNHYYYFSVKKDGRVIKVGEYTRIYNSITNSFDATGVSMWGLPK